jgi:hypothetical protein
VDIEKELIRRGVNTIEVMKRAREFGKPDKQYVELMMNNL